MPKLPILVANGMISSVFQKLEILMAIGRIIHI